MPDSGSIQLIAHIVPDYELLQRIGAGAYGEVWLARSKATGILRAAKIVWRHRFDHDRPFQREFEGIQRFERISREHPSQLALFHIGRNEAEGCFYYVMELADNIGTAGEYAPRTLRAELANGRLPVDQVLDISVSLTKALGHLHQNGLVHRDVKPSNVIFVNGRPKLADIGLVTDASDSRSIVGTEGYLPPEGPGTPQADIFALGKVLYEITTGLDRRRFPDLPAQLKEWPDGTAVLELNEAVLKACGNTAAGRYQTCVEMQADLELLQQGESLQRKRTYQQWLEASKKAGLVLSGLVFAVAAIVFGMRHLAPREYSGDGPPSTNRDASMLCEQGMFIVRGDRYPEFPQAYTNFHRAIELDPHYVRPYVGLLELRFREYVPSVGLTSWTEMGTIAQQLQKLGPHLAATQVAQSVLNWSDWNYPQAQRCALQAIKADPKYELGRTSYAFLLALWGYPVEARAQLTISEDLRPSKATVYRVRGQTYYVQRDYTNAMYWALKALDCDPHEAVAYYTIGCAYQAMNDYSNALVNLELCDICISGDKPKTQKYYHQLRLALKEDGPQGYWQQDLKQTHDNQFYWKAVAEIHLGNTNNALAWLEKSCAVHEYWPGSHDGPLSYLLLDQDWDELHKNVRFKAVLDKVGFTKVRPP